MCVKSFHHSIKYVVTVMYLFYEISLCQIFKPDDQLKIIIVSVVMNMHSFNGTAEPLFSEHVRGIIFCLDN